MLYVCEIQFIAMEKSPAFYNDKLKWIAIGVTLVIAILLTVVGIYWIADYGVALFLILPVFMGACPAVIYGRKEHISSGQALWFGFITLGLYGFGLMVFAIEGLICIFMAFPIAMLFSSLGS